MMTALPGAEVFDVATTPSNSVAPPDTRELTSNTAPVGLRLFVNSDPTNVRWAARSVCTSTAPPL